MGNHRPSYLSLASCGYDIPPCINIIHSSGLPKSTRGECYSEQMVSHSLGSFKLGPIAPGTQSLQSRFQTVSSLATMLKGIWGSPGENFLSTPIGMSKRTEATWGVIKLEQRNKARERYTVIGFMVLSLILFAFQNFKNKAFLEESQTTLK